MEKIKFRNKFRILSPTGKVMRLNSIINNSGNYQYVEGFKTLEEAQATRNFWAKLRKRNPEDYTIESYSDNVKHLIKPLSAEGNAFVKHNHIFSGKGLKYNTSLQPKDENKYSSTKFYGREVWMFQSTERNKGTTLFKGNKRKAKTAYHDYLTFRSLNSRPEQATFNLSFDLIKSLRKKKFNNRKELKDYLKKRKFTNRQINKIVPKYYYS